MITEPAGRLLSGTVGPLLNAYAGLVCDLDGVVYRGAAAVPHAVETLSAAFTAGIGVVYATNNASRPPASVAAQLRGLGLTLADSAVVTSSQAGAQRIVDLLGTSGTVLAVGGAGVREALQERGFSVVVADLGAVGAQHVAAVLQGYGPDVGWRDLAAAAYAVSSGAVWVATNDDMTLPTEHGRAPGNGTLVAAVRAAVDVDPIVVGKPHTPLYELSAQVLGIGADRTLAIGDRLDTDIAGAVSAGMHSLLVLTGVSSVADLVAAPPGARPQFVGLDLRTLLVPHPEVTREGGDAGLAAVWTCGDARVQLDGGRLSGLTAGALEHRLAAAVSALWAAHDGEVPADPGAGSAAWPVDALEAVVAMVEGESD